MIEEEGLEIFWNGNASVRIEDNGFTVAVDPFREAFTDFEADIVLVTHQDSEHFDLEAIDEVSYPRTVLLLPESMRDVETSVNDVEYIGEEEVVDIYNVEIEGVPMSNEYHERGQGLGYRFVMDSTSFYIAGDTGIFDGVLELENRVDYAFLPVEGEHSMDVSEASKMAAKVKPSVTVPYHYDDGVDLRSFKTELKRRSLSTEIMEPEKE